MKTPVVLLTALLAGTVLFLGTLAWRQHSELIRLRAAALDHGDRAALQKRIRDAEKRAQLSEARALAAQPAATETTAEPTDPTATTQLKNLPPADKKGPSPQEILAFLSNPEMQLKLATKFREQVDARYSTLFKNLNLSGPQQAQMRELLIERQGAVIDVAAAMLAAGGKLKEKDLQTLVAGAQDETDRKLQATFGPAVFTQFQTYENAQLFRGATSDLQKNLARSNVPLNASQAEQFTLSVSTLAQINFTPDQQKALLALNRAEQSKQTIRQVEQLYKEETNPPKPAKPNKADKPAKRPGG
jgi:hypothetical protein